MAKVHSTGTHLPVEISKAVEALMSLPDGWDIYVGWPEFGAVHPDLLVVSPEQKLLFVSATGASADLLDAFVLGKPPEESDSRALKRLYRAVESLRDPLPGIEAARVLILTNAAEDEVRFSFIQTIGALGIGVLDVDRIDQPQLDEFCTSLLPAEGRIADARACIAPQSTIVPALVPAKAASCPTRLRFLDTVQEDWLRAQLQVPEEVDQFARTGGRYLLKGPAGCGKTLLLLIRAVLECQVRSGVRPLVLTHNRPLVHDLEERLRVLAQSHGQHLCETRTFLSWCWEWSGGWSSPVVYGERDGLIARSIESTPSAEAIRFHGEEYAYIQDNIIESREQYLEFRRQGRQRALQPAQREAVWERFERYKAALHRLGRYDYPTLQLELFKRVRAGELQPEKRDMVVVDEGQFLPPSLVGVLRHAIDDEGVLVIAADHTQGFLQRRRPWERAELEIPPKNQTRLTKPYRSTRAILRFARTFHESRMAADAENELPRDEDIVGNDDGVWPEVIRSDRLHHEEGKTVELVQLLVTSGTQPSQILVIPCDNRAVAPLVQSLQNAGQMAACRWSAQLARSACDPREVRVCTVDSATGLEAPYVIVLGARTLLESELDARMAEEHRQMRQDNTARLYMAFTRAGYRLSVIWSGEQTPPFPEDPS